MNIRFIALILSILFLLINGSYAQTSSEIDFSETPYYYSLKKAIRNKEKAFKLNLSNSGLKDFPIEILELKELRYLILDSNQITIIPEGIKLLNKLEVFSISNNEIHSITSAIGDLQKLYYLDVGYNRIVDLPSELFLLHNLESLSINNNSLSLFPADFMKLKELRSIIASNNKFEVIPDEIGHLYNLKKLSLSNNHLKRLPDKFFELSNLEFLYLYGNQLTSIDSKIQKLGKLEKLHLGENKLKTLPHDIGKLYNLTELYLNDNILESIPLDINSFLNLSILNLNNNPIPILPTDLVNLKKLKFLSLEGNIFEPFPQVLYDLHNKGVKINGLTTKELYKAKLLLSKARNKKLIENYDEAIEKYNELLLLDTNNVQVMSELAACHLEMSRFNIAKTICEKALAKNEEDKLNRKLKNIYDKCLTKTNKSTKLNSEYEEKFNKNPSDISPYFELGKKYYESKKYNKALIYFQRVIKLDPLFPDAHFYLAVVSLIQEQKPLFIFSTLRYLILEQNGKKAKTILPFLLSKMKMKTGVSEKNGNTNYYDSYIISDDDGEVIYKSESPTANLLSAMISDLAKSNIIMTDTIENDTVMKKSILNAIHANKTNVEIFKYELNSICISDTNETEQSGSDFMDFYLPFYTELINGGYLETFSYIINSIRSPEENYIDNWIKNNPNKIDEFYLWSNTYKWDAMQTLPSKK